MQNVIMLISMILGSMCMCGLSWSSSFLIKWQSEYSYVSPGTSPYWTEGMFIQLSFVSQAQ